MKNVTAVETSTSCKLFYWLADYVKMEIEIKASEKSTLKKHGWYSWKHRRRLKKAEKKKKKKSQFIIQGNHTKCKMQWMQGKL